MEVRIRVPFLFPVVYFSRGTLPQKSWQEGTTGGPRICLPKPKPRMRLKSETELGTQGVRKTSHDWTKAAVTRPASLLEAIGPRMWLVFLELAPLVGLVSGEGIRKTHPFWGSSKKDTPMCVEEGL